MPCCTSYLATGARRKARWIVATNVPASHKSAEEVLQLDKGQNGVEHGFAFRKRSPVPGLVRVFQKGRTGDGDGLRDGPLPACLSARGAPSPAAFRRDRSHRA